MALVTLDNTITIALSVSDRHASAIWFAEKLGFGLLYHADDVGWTEMSTMTEGVTLGMSEQAQASPGNAVPVFGTADISKSRQALEGAAVKFDGETEVIEGMVSTCTFYDPDGNAIMLAQDHTKYPGKA